ncbi:MAG: serine/threonine protein phosphatase [Devosia sp.]|nr:serine/threonine protein phosphatase [Devosia sp.]
MIFGGFLDRLWGRSSTPSPAGRTRLSAARVPPSLYAIGDVHGHLDLLKALEGQLFAHAAGDPGEKWVVMLGDYIDRGPQSAAVLDHLLAPLPAGWRRICLCGNHEDAMAGAMRDRKAFARWITFGGMETLMSYGIASSEVHAACDDARAHARLIQSFIPQEHGAFLDALPSILETPNYIFVHAGLRPGVPVKDQVDDDLLWFRENGGTPYDFGATVVHGHTPVTEPFFSQRRINIDTGAYATGRLTAVFLGEELQVLQSSLPRELSQTT